MEYSSLVEDLKEGLNKYFYEVKDNSDENIIDINGKVRYYQKFENIMRILRLNSGIMIYYYDKKFENILESFQENYDFEYYYITIGI